MANKFCLSYYNKIQINTFMGCSGIILILLIKGILPKLHIYIPIIFICWWGIIWHYLVNVCLQ